MSFADQLKSAKGDLTARQVADVIAADLSHRTVEDWLAGRRTPPKWQQKLIYGMLANATGRPPVETWDGCETSAEVAEYLAAEKRGMKALEKRPKAKGHNNEVAGCEPATHAQHNRANSHSAH
jgi:hypothetical protein